MITVAGEALIDLISEEAGRLTPLAGGAGFNVARIVARLGEPCNYLGRLAADQYGEQLSGELIDSGAKLAIPERVNAPTTLAIAHLDSAGSAEYRFYVEGTSAVAVSPGDVPTGLFDGCRCFALGGLSIVFEPIRSTLLELVKSAPASALVLLDPNCRPHAIPDLESYRRTVEHLFQRADIVKVSVEDLGVIRPGSVTLDYATEIVARGVCVVVITDGPGPVTIVCRDGLRRIPVPSVNVVDTIGAGDAVVAGLLAWLTRHPDFDPRTVAVDLWENAVEAALEVAAAVCTAQGATLRDGFKWTAH
jgi:fructokinase